MKEETFLTLTQGDVHVFIIESGWKDKYHVIIEDPTEGDLYHNHEFLSKNEIYDRYKIDLNKRS